GRSRLDWSLAEKPEAVIVELGGNDGLRAVDPKVTGERLISPSGAGGNGGVEAGRGEVITWVLGL
ncbi:MAG: hypothetical protein ACO3A2_06295, partial [Bdellovibrionia bacterium]